MPETVTLDQLVEQARTRGDTERWNAAEIGDSLQTIRMAFERSANRFARHKAISGEIGKAASRTQRDALFALRTEFEAEIRNLAIAEIESAFERSPGEGWQTWLRTFAEGIEAEYATYCIEITHHPFPFPQDVEPRVLQMRSAASLYLQGRWEEFEEHLDFLRDQQFVAPVTRARLTGMCGEVRLYWSDWDGARERFEAAESLAPNEAAVLAMVGNYWLSKWDYDSALEYYRRAKENDPTAVDGYIGFGDAAKKRAELGKAEQYFREAVSAAPGSPRGYERLIGVLANPAQFKEREAEFVALLELAVAVTPENEYDLYSNVGGYYADNNHSQEAVRYYEKCIALQPAWPRAYDLLASFWMSANEPSKAEELWNKSIELDAAYPNSYLGLGELYETRKQWTQAAKTFEALPPRPAAYRELARAYACRMWIRAGRYDEAERAVRDELPAGRIGSRPQAAMEEIAEAYLSAGNRSAAERIYAEILTKIGDVYKAAYYNRLGNLLSTFEEHDAAVEQYQLAIHCEPKNAVYRRNLATTYEDLRHHADADRELQAAFALDHDEAALHERQALFANRRGNEMYEAGKYDEAIPFYEKAIELDRTNSVYYTNLAGAWELGASPNREGALKNAIAAYERAQAIEPSEKNAKKLDRLRKGLDFARLYGTNVLEYVYAAVPLLVEVAHDLIPFIKGAEPETLAENVAAEVAGLRSRMREELGIVLPGIRFRGNETDFADGTYVIMLNELPAASGTISPDRRFTPVARETLGDVGETSYGSDPVTGASGLWVGRDHWKTLDDRSIELWDITHYILRHLEAMVRANAGEFCGHQDVVHLLDSDVHASETDAIQSSPELLTDLVAVCRALLAEGVPIAPFGVLCAHFKKLRAAGVATHDIVEQIRALPEFRNRLLGNAPGRAILRLTSNFEHSLRNALYERDGSAILALEPESCEEALAAVRNAISQHSPVALLVEDARLRPFVRKLIELDWPAVPVLSGAEVCDNAVIADADSTEFENAERRSEASTVFAGRRWPKTAPAEEIEWSTITDPAVRPSITVFAAGDFESAPSAFDDKPISEMFSTMRDGLFYELGVLLPRPRFVSERRSKFRFQINGVNRGPFDGLGKDEFLVNETPERLDLLGISGRDGINPATGARCTIIRDDNGKLQRCLDADLTTWGPAGYVVLTLASELRRVAASFQTRAVTQYALDSLALSFPALVATALSRYSVDRVTLILRALIDEQIGIRDLRSVLEGLLSITATTDVDFSRFIVFIPYTDNLCPASPAQELSTLTASEIAESVRIYMRRAIGTKYLGDASTLFAYLLDRTIETRLAEAAERPLSQEEADRLLAAIHSEVAQRPTAGGVPVVLTSVEIRRFLRKLIEDELPNLPVVSYQELPFDIKIQPLGRVDWTSASAVVGGER